MSNKEIPDIGEMYKLWEMKDEIRSTLMDSYYESERNILDREILTLVNKIESLGKKEGE